MSDYSLKFKLGMEMGKVGLDHGCLVPTLRWGKSIRVESRASWIWGKLKVFY